MFKQILIGFCIGFASPVLSQYNPSIDVQHYEFNLRLSDANDSVQGRALIDVRFVNKTSIVWFDLANVNDTGRGMTVTAVRQKKKNLAYTHTGNVLRITLPKQVKAGETETIEIVYTGIPADGLIISKNKYGHRTFFGDNWPNRAHYWIPCKDHLSDKAPVDFIVTAPAHYRVVANGIKKEEAELARQMHRTHWKEDAPLATKVMVIGVADFAVDHVGDTSGIPVSSWVFPEQKEKGFYDYGQALDILPFFITHVGPYPYKKLANVQSKTIFGGMENAGAIFYYENSITGTRKTEELLAHEIAHQWFGDAVTETDWPHLWLSEGFATEMTTLYLENKYGRDTLVKRLLKDRNLVIAFTKAKKLPVVDTAESSHLTQLLNQNSYQKGGWILHMLRNQLGDGIFWKGIRNYYDTYRNGNASTADLQKIMEQASGKSLQNFFDQWLYTPENPSLQVNWSYNEGRKEVFVTVTQQTNRIFSFPLELEITGASVNHVRQWVEISKAQHTFSFPVAGKPDGLTPDPDCKLLFEASVKENAQ